MSCLEELSSTSRYWTQLGLVTVGGLLLNFGLVVILIDECYRAWWLLLGWVVMHEYYRAGWLWMSVTESGGY